jgi:hypothetical protein
MTINAIGMERLCEMQAAIGNAGGTPPVVIDSDDLVTRPGATMAAYCAAVGLPFSLRALTWERGEQPEWRRAAFSPSLLRSTPVTGSTYGSSGIYGCRYRETVLRYSSAALISPSTYADTSRSCAGLNAPGTSTCTDCAAERAPSKRARWRASASYRS